MKWKHNFVRLFEFRMSGKPDFIYDYTFAMNYNWKVKVTVDYEFENVDGVETISRFPHAQRRIFASNLIQKYGPSKFHQLAEADICNPFARELAKLFNDNMQVYWMRRQTDSVLILTGYFQKLSILGYVKLILTLWMELTYDNQRIVVFDYFGCQKTSSKSYSGGDAAEEDDVKAIPASIEN